MKKKGKFLIPLQIFGGLFCLLTQTYTGWIEKKKYILNMIVIKIDKTNINSTRQQTQLNHF